VNPTLEFVPGLIMFRLLSNLRGSASKLLKKQYTIPGLKRMYRKIWISLWSHASGLGILMVVIGATLADQPRSQKIIILFREE
jgi:hypothetical protein